MHVRPLSARADAEREGPHTEVPTRPIWNNGAFVNKLEKYIIYYGMLAKGRYIRTLCGNLGWLRGSDVRSGFTALGSGNWAKEK